MGEQWKDVPGYGGKYKVSNKGKIWSYNRKGRELKPYISRHGYLRVCLSKEGKCRHHLIHRLVATCFIVEDIIGKEIDHIDGDRLNNNTFNLRTTTPLGNRANMKKRCGFTSKYKGVSWDSIREKWKSSICRENKRIHIGRFTNEKEAAREYDEKALELFGEFAKTNKDMGLL